ncbi:valine--tRNA ligase [Carboxydocella sp. JDF658]|uniref:valine--tRNA ligase n=1 Tax=Carboxydocella sp. JDF658 TaxID=1926600 RepID=UPI0009AE35B6|nr:valine--tRNA ligase [Carboxydocella sp. JDF658]GAW31695.1 valine--tRNA ligase [Carboxydocella sp. JDF658]
MTTATRSGQLPTTYNPQEVESKWYSRWEEKGYFHAEVDKNKEPFSIVMPPPNVTGALHMGHALDNTMQDILIRWKRMQGYNTLWMPGTDHAGIATQAKVEEQLAKEGLSKYDLGREKFLERVWDWKNTYGDRITKQLRRLGASCDWQRERFTMDEGCSKAVRDVFVELYNKGLIYRGSYIINWCPKCMTTISDIEVEHEETAGKLYHIAYPVKDSQERIIVATTRPETMLGDVAVAVHPEDERYRHLIGKTLILPILGREIPVIADEYVEKEFGTGAVKITPAHDLNDFEIGQRHHLPQITVMTREGLMNEEAGPYQGMERYACRAQIVKDLEAQGYLVKVEDHTHAVGHCYRCDTVIEPMVSPQWFVKMKPLAEPAIKVVQEGKLRFVPERFTKIYINWLENIRDWCISRQLWWGHRIPVWYCQDCGAEICAKENPTSCPHCGSTNLEQDPDVLDTWFSSALWPFSTMGWPEQTEELAHFYPTSVLVTGRDIIFFWVARMIFMGLEFMQERPFKEVLIHGLVLDAQGRKMSKSLGNGVDPIDIIDQYGADTLRFMLITGNTPGNDLRFQQERLEGTRNFANKIWNAARFALLNLGDFKPEEVQPELALADRWILSRLNHTIEEVTRQLGRYELGEAARVLYDFIWSEFCDWYIELIKPRLYGKETPGSRATAQWTLWYVLSRTMELLHPFMPFITEEIWQALPHQGETIMLAPWPQVKSEFNAPDAEAAMELLMEAIRAVRNVRAEMNVPPSRQIAAIMAANRQENLAVLQAGAGYLKQLAGIGELELVLTLQEKPAQAAAAVAKGVEIYLPLAGLIDIEKEKERLAKELAKVEEDLARVEAKLNNESFVARAPAAVVEKEKARAAEYREKAEALRERLAALG